MTTTEFRNIGRKFALEAINVSHTFETMRDAITNGYSNLANHLSAYGRFDVAANEAYKGFHQVADQLETA